MVSNIALPALGIDISKKTIDVAVLLNDCAKSRKFSNDAAGFLELSAWILEHAPGGVHACMEATGRYYEAAAKFLVSAGHVVSVINPAKLKGYAQSELKRAKTDNIDANLIARFCQRHRPEPWVDLEEEVREIQEAMRYLESLKTARQQERNRLKSGLICEPVCKLIEVHIDQLDANIGSLENWIEERVRSHQKLNEHYELITSVIGIGEVTAFTWLAELGYLERFEQSRQLESFVGMSITKCQSGTSVRGRERFSKVGNAYIRKALFMPAMNAMRYNPMIRTFAERLKERGKPPKVVVGAVMRKLLRIIFAVIKSKQPFRLDYRCSAGIATG